MQQTKIPAYAGIFVCVHEKVFGGATQSRTGLTGFAIPCITDLLSRRYASCIVAKNMGKPEGLSQVIWSGKRDSNSRPIPWQGIALPTELFPQKRSPHYKEIELRVNKLKHIFLFLFEGRSSLYNAPLKKFGTTVPIHLSARVVKLVDTTDLKSVATVKRAYRFDSGLGHQN